MRFRSIDNKQIVGDKLRMTEPTILFRPDTPILTTHIVDEFEVGRADIIAEKYYRNPAHAEMILKFNKISNPFSITAGEELLIPDFESALLQWKKIKPIEEVGSESIDSVRAQFMDTKRLSTKDANRVEYLKKKAARLKNGSKEILPPNLLKPGENNIDITDDSITI